MSRFARNRDSNEQVIVAALLAVGASVQRLNETGTPDLLVGYRGRDFLLEIKREGVKGGRRHYGGLDERGLAKTQQAWFAKWKGAAPAIVTSGLEALEAIGAIDDRLPPDAIGSSEPSQSSAGAEDANRAVAGKLGGNP